MIEVKIPEDSSLVFDFDKNNEEKPVSIGVSYIEPGQFNKTMVVLSTAQRRPTQRRSQPNS